MNGFTSMFNATCDTAIMAALGDDIALTPPVGSALNIKCVLATRTGGKQHARIEWLDNIIAKVDINSVVVELPESDAPGLGENWTAQYLGKTYVVSKVLPKGDGMLVVILNQEGNSTATENGWS